MGLLSNYREVLNTPARRQVMLALCSTFLLVQVASFPVALALPSIAEDFLIDVETAAWVLVAELLALGATVYLAAKLGDRYGHSRIFFFGIVITTLGAVAAGFAMDFTQLLIFRGVQGLGAALVTGNANAILAGTFAAEERGRAFAVPITAARFGTFAGLITFAIFLQFLGWRFIFFSFIPLGIVAVLSGLPLLKQKEASDVDNEGPVDFGGAFLFIGMISAMILSGLHLHSGEESFTSDDAVSYHVPMHILTVVLLVAFIIYERRIKQPFVDLGQFKNRHFSLALFSNTTFHLSMLAIMTLVPILVEKGFGYGPLFVIYVLLPHQSMGLFIPILAGWYYDRYRPRLMRPISLSLIALGIFLLGMFALKIPFWLMPLLLLPASIGTSIFNTINNAVIMNSVGDERRGFASGMIETTRHVGHTLGATVAASALGLVMPAGIALLSEGEAREFYFRGLQTSALVVVWIILAGALVAFNHRVLPTKPKAEAAKGAG